MSGSYHIRSFEIVFKVLKLSLNLEYWFSFNFQLRNAATEFCFLFFFHANKVPELKTSKLNKSDVYYFRSDYFQLKLKKNTNAESIG